ncbi:uncharacterized protein LOC102680028 [Apis dorsata]|uniref:uncharacterized protein LOC102680028 n=1 Tax=Apis dorsata TaxID=7462 RepID=UPI0012934529|nr:uncharacterized protein LOC102680028 [Apis dorsata]
MGSSERMPFPVNRRTPLSSIIAISAFMLHSGIVALRMTALQIPQHVVLNETVRMQCNFNLDKELLYSVKWYKDGHEFYRYVPRDVPMVQTFRVPGVDVNTHNSTERSVVLNNVNLTSSGRYRCEVSAEAPAFQTVSDHADMTVVGKETYFYDSIRFTVTKIIDDIFQADNQYLKGPHITAVDEKGLETAVLGLEFRVANKHFKRGDMKLKCLATIATVYLQSNEESVEGDERILKAPVMESRETRAQSHTRNDLINGSQTTTIFNRMIVFLIIGIILAR